MPPADAARRSPGTTLAVLALGVLAYALSQTMIAPAMPDIQHSLGITTSAVAWTLTAYLVAASVMTAVIGRLGDMLGKKRVLVATLIAFGVGSAICAMAPSIGVLIVGRVVQGAAGGLFPLAFGIVRDEFPRDRVAGGIGLISSIMGVGAGFGSSSAACSSTTPAGTGSSGSASRSPSSPSSPPSCSCPSRRSADPARSTGAAPACWGSASRRR